MVAAAVVLDPAHIPDGIADCKALDVEARRALYQAILATAHVGIGVAEVDRIDTDNILNASLWAMAQAVARLTARPSWCWSTATRRRRSTCATRTIVQGDAKCLSIAAASIVAKVARDAMMAELARAYPDYGFDRHKGYGTPRASCRHRPLRRHAAPSPLVQARAAGPRAGTKPRPSSVADATSTSAAAAPG